MKVIVRQEFRNGLRNPILWAGLVFIFLGLFQILSPYLSLHYFSEEEFARLEDMDMEHLGDADVMDGYIPATKEEQRRVVYQQIYQLFIEEGYPEDKAEEMTEEIAKKELDENELEVYLMENYPFYDAYYGISYYFGLDIRKGTREEVNSYIQQKLEEHPFSWYFARKFADFSGLFFSFFSAILLAFLYIRDTKRDMYELLHTKPIKAAEYIGGKILGGFFILIFALAILIAIFEVLCIMAGNSAGLPVDLMDIPAAALMYVIPNILLIACVYTIVAVIFKSPFPGVPLLFLHMVYSNMGSVGADGRYGYYGRPLAIMVRFPGELLDVASPPMALLNQCFVIVASVVLFGLSAMLWKRRQMY